MKKTVYSYRIHVNGIFGRNRVAKFKSFDFSLDNERPRDFASFANEWPLEIAKLKIKPGGRVSLNETKEELEEGPTFTSRSFMMFQDQKKIHAEVIT